MQGDPPKCGRQIKIKCWEIRPVLTVKISILCSRVDMHPVDVIYYGMLKKLNDTKTVFG